MATRTRASIGLSGELSHSVAFRGFHPVVPAVLFAVILILSMTAFHPILCALSLVAALIFGCICRGVKAVGKSLLWAMPLVALVVLLNPFFSALGTTQVGSLLGYPLYQESLAYGACMGMLMCSMLMWMQNAASVITMEDTLSLVGKAAPVVGLMMSMIARLIPRYMQQGRMLTFVQTANTCVPVQGVQSTVRAAKRFGTLLSWSMEDSLITADAMAARGWNTHVRRSSYERRPIKCVDVAALCMIIVVTILAAIEAWHITTGFSFYPQMGTLQPQVGMAVYILLLMLPCLFELIEVLRWRR